MKVAANVGVIPEVRKILLMSTKFKIPQYITYGPGSSVGRGKETAGRPRRRWVDNIRMDLQEAGCGHVDWIGLAQDRDGWRKLVNAVMNLRVP